MEQVSKAGLHRDDARSRWCRSGSRDPANDRSSVRYLQRVLLRSCSRSIFNHGSRVESIYRNRCLVWSHRLALFSLSKYF